MAMIIIPIVLSLISLKVVGNIYLGDYKHSKLEFGKSDFSKNPISNIKEANEIIFNKAIADISKILIF